MVGLLASPAVAKKTGYLGPIIGPGQGPGSSVAFKVDSSRKGGKSRPVAVLRFKFYFFVAACSSGRQLQSTLVRGLPRLPVRNRQFVGTSTSDNLTYEIRGRVPRKGPAAGTIRVTGSYVLPDAGTIFCDWTANWTANKIDSDELPE